MKLSDLLQFDNIIVQCHDNPDADALASGFGVYEYLRMNGKVPDLYTEAGILYTRAIWCLW